MTPRDDEAARRKKADEVRARLLEVVDELDRRRHSFAHPMQAVRAVHVEPAWLAAAAAAAVLGFSLVGVLGARRRRREQRFLNRLLRPRPPFAEDVLSRAGRALATFALVQFGKQGLSRVSRARA